MRWRLLIAPAFIVAALGRVTLRRVHSWRTRHRHAKRIGRRRNSRTCYNGWEWSGSASDSTSSAADVLALLKKSVVNTAPSVTAYRLNACLFTEAERKFLDVLEQVVENNYRVFAKVRVADILEPDAAPHTDERRSGFRVIARKHFDYVLCGPDALNVRAVIELQDPSPKGERRQKHDAFLDEICRKAHLPLIRFNIESEYDSAKVSEKLCWLLDGECGAQKCMKAESDHDQKGRV